MASASWLCSARCSLAVLGFERCGFPRRIPARELVGFFKLADIESELSRLLGGRKVDLRTPMDLGRYLSEEVVRDALVLYAEP